jgi:hypothetical protein
MRSAACVSFILAALATGCGARASSSAAPNTPSTPRSSASSSGFVGSGATVADAVQTCHAVSPRTDYTYVASYRCPDGSVPLGGDPARGQAARLGNVGAGPDGHILDLYEIPCSTPVRLYVDAYHCPAGVQAEPDPQHLTRDQLASLSRMIHGVAGDVTSPRAFQLRQELLQWIIATPQVSVIVCEGLGQLFPPDDPHAYTSELVIAMAAAVIDDGRDPADGPAVTVAGILDVLVYYQAIVASEGAAARSPQMDALVQSARDGSLSSRVAFVMSGCDTSHMGVHY